MSEFINLNFEILQGFHTNEELDNYIKNDISKCFNTEINAYSSTEGNIKIEILLNTLFI